LSSGVCGVFVEAGLQAGQADLKVGLYTNNSGLVSLRVRAIDLVRSREPRLHDRFSRLDGEQVVGERGADLVGVARLEWPQPETVDAAAQSFRDQESHGVLF
jgi:hypothetical protein